MPDAPTDEMTEALAFLRAVAEAELRTRRAHMIEPDEKKFIKILRELDAMYLRSMSSGLSRPEEPRSKYREPRRIAAAAVLQARTVFAVARYDLPKVSRFRGWLGDTERGERGEAICENLWVEKQKTDGFKIIALYVPCRTCWGSRRIRDGMLVCPDCIDGWEHRNGTKFKRTGNVSELVSISEPKDPLSKPLQKQIEELARKARDRQKELRKREREYARAMKQVAAAKPKPKKKKRKA